MTLLRVLSLGAGVQSTTLALMAAHGEIGPMPDCAIFADTQDEPAAVYAHLAWLMSPNVLPFPVHIATAGKLSSRLADGHEEARIPAFVKGSGISKRQCTTNYKLKPIRRKIREILGVSTRGYIRPGSVEQWVGISTNEAHRLKPSGVSYIVRRDPLIEAGMSRSDCLGWLRRHDYPLPPKSSCNQCAFQSDRQWEDKAPADFAAAVAVDRWLREPPQIKRFHGELYLHRSCIPLDLVNFAAERDRQPDLFGNECEGMCGV